MKDLTRLARYVLKYRMTLALAVVCAVLASLLTGAAISLLKPLLQEFGQEAGVVSALAAGGAGPSTSSSSLVPEFVSRWQLAVQGWTKPLRDWLAERGFVRIPIAIAVLYLLKGICGYLSAFSMNRVSLSSIRELRAELYSHVLSQSDEFYRVHGTAEMQSRIMGDVHRLQSIVGGEMAQAVQAVPLILVLLVLSFLNAWQLTVLCLVSIPAFGYAVGRLGRRVKSASRRSQERSAKLQGLISETLIARRVVHAFEATRYEIERFRSALDSMFAQDLKVARAQAATTPSMELLGSVVGAGLIIYAGWLMRRGSVDGRDLFTSVVCLLLVFNSVRRIGNLSNMLQQASASARRLYEILDSPNTVVDAANAIPLPPFRDEIRFEGVAFTYGRGPVLESIDLVVKKGEIHALIGPSGAGKSTLAALLLRFADPTAGRLTIDGHDLREVTLHSLRCHIALVTQETHLFDDTVMANIAYANSQATIEEVERAARGAHADEFIRPLPEGYRTRLGERGGGLSSGQRQRIAIARAFLKDAPILVLDEATSQLDPAAERVVQSALDALLTGRTALIIAHRLNTVQRADCIHVLEGGRVVESGRHSDLLARGGLYARLLAAHRETGGVIDSNGGNAGFSEERATP